MPPFEDTCLWHITVPLNILRAGEKKADFTDKLNTSCVSQPVRCLLLVFVLHGFPRPVADSKPGGSFGAAAFSVILHFTWLYS